MCDKKISDLSLVKRFRKGDLDAFEELIRRYQSKAFNLAMRLTRNTEDAEEVLQDVFSTLYRKAAGFEGKSAFSSWLYRITVNASFMLLRKRKQQSVTYLEDITQQKHLHHLDNDPLIQQRSDSITYRHELRDRLSDAIDKLPEQYRAVFVLRDVDGLSNNEVSEILDLTIPAVKSRLHRSRLMLRKKLLRYYKEFSEKKRVVIEELDDNNLDSYSL
jgi:RNA polymerase sigma-70 factor (ECF subfamily)